MPNRFTLDILDGYSLSIRPGNDGIVLEFESPELLSDGSPEHVVRVPMPWDGFQRLAEAGAELQNELIQHVTSGTPQRPASVDEGPLAQPTPLLDEVEQRAGAEPTSVVVDEDDPEGYNGQTGNSDDAPLATVDDVLKEPAAVRCASCGARDVADCDRLEGSLATYDPDLIAEVAEAGCMRAQAFVREVQP